MFFGYAQLSGVNIGNDCIDGVTNFARGAGGKRVALLPGGGDNRFQAHKTLVFDVVILSETKDLTRKTRFFATLRMTVTLDSARLKAQRVAWQ